MTVFVKNLIINAGEDFSEDLEILSADGSGVVNLSGFSATSHMRKHPDSTNFVGIAVSIKSPIQGLVNISIADTITSNIKPGRHVYDVMLTRPSGSKIIGVEGSVLVRAGISTGCF
mgnify:FL=1